MIHDHPEGAGRCGGRKGALTEPLVLAALQRTVAHGYDLRTAITQMTDERATIDAGGLYRTLRRLEEDGFVTSEWTEGESGPQRRAYCITAEGLELAEDWARHLRSRSELLALVAGLLESAEAPCTGLEVRR
jgi:DNA-binding PadR family transcriptional regulator